MVSSDTHLQAGTAQHAGGLIGLVPGLVLGAGGHTGAHDHRIGELGQVISDGDPIGAVDQHQVHIVLLGDADGSADVIGAVGVHVDRHLLVQDLQHILHADVPLEPAAALFRLLLVVAVLDGVLQALAQVIGHAHAGLKAVLGGLGGLAHAALHGSVAPQ